MEVACLPKKFGLKPIGSSTNLKSLIFPSNSSFKFLVYVVDKCTFGSYIVILRLIDANVLSWLTSIPLSLSSSNYELTFFWSLLISSFAVSIRSHLAVASWPKIFADINSSNAPFFSRNCKCSRGTYSLYISLLIFSPHALFREVVWVIILSLTDNSFSNISYNYWTSVVKVSCLYWYSYIVSLSNLFLYALSTYQESSIFYSETFNSATSVNNWAFSISRISKN